MSGLLADATGSGRSVGAADLFITAGFLTPTVKFVAAEYDDGERVEAELAVWDRLKRCFGHRYRCRFYYRFPIIDGQNNDLDREADFVVLHRK